MSQPSKLPKPLPVDRDSSDVPSCDYGAVGRRVWAEQCGTSSLARPSGKEADDLNQ